MGRRNGFEHVVELEWSDAVGLEVILRFHAHGLSATIPGDVSVLLWRIGAIEITPLHRLTADEIVNDTTAMARVFRVTLARDVDAGAALRRLRRSRLVRAAKAVPAIEPVRA